MISSGFYVSAEQLAGAGTLSSGAQSPRPGRGRKWQLGPALSYRTENVALPECVRAAQPALGTCECLHSALTGLHSAVSSVLEVAARVVEVGEVRRWREEFPRAELAHPEAFIRQGVVAGAQIEPPGIVARSSRRAVSPGGSVYIRA